MKEINIIPLPLGELQANCYIVSLRGGNQAVLIDPGDGSIKAVAAINAALAGKSVAAILLTHAHGDHIAGLSAFPDAPVYIHEQDAAALTDPALNCCDMLGMPAPARGADRTVREGDALTLAGMTFTALHTPGHTPGGVCWRVGDNLFTGDTLFADGYGRTDLPGGDWHQLTLSLRRLWHLAGSLRVLPGHGRETTLHGEGGA